MDLASFHHLTAQAHAVDRRVEFHDRVLAAAITRAKVEIRADIANGVLPADVGCFAELHDHVDANDYGGLRELVTLDGAALITLAAKVQDEVDAWLVAGRR